MGLQIVRLIGTTDSSGDVTVNHTTTVQGLLYMVEWIDGDLADGNDAVLSVQSVAGESAAATTLLTLTNANSDARYYPRALTHDDTGTALTGTAGGDRVAPVVSGVPRLVISSGGDTKTGGCVLYIVTP